MTEEPDDLALLARWAVDGTDLPDLASWEDERWQALLRAARTQRLAGVLAAMVSVGAPITVERWEDVAALESEWAMHTLRAERAAVEVVAALREEGIETRLLKGSFLAHRYWPAPHLRVFGDADVLVRSNDLDRAVEVVRSLGGVRLLPQVRPGFDRRFGKSVTMRSADNVEVDFHRTLVAGPHAFTIPEVDLWESPEEVVVAGRTMRGLSAAAQLVHTATHTVSSRSPRLHNLMDVALVAERADLDEAARLAERWRVRAVVVESGRRVGAVLGDRAVTRWAAALRPSAEEERLLQVVDRSSFRRAAWATVPYIPRWRDRARFLVSLGLPSRAHRRAR
jgi:hypothetical protein